MSLAVTKYRFKTQQALNPHEESGVGIPDQIFKESRNFGNLSPSQTGARLLTVDLGVIYSVPWSEIWGDRSVYRIRSRDEGDRLVYRYRLRSRLISTLVSEISSRCPDVHVPLFPWKYTVGSAH